MITPLHLIVKENQTHVYTTSSISNSNAEEDSIRSQVFLLKKIMFLKILDKIYYSSLQVYFML